MTLSREFGRSSLLTSSPKTYLYRWTFATCLPADKKSHAYAVLRRVWADHTMNTVKWTDAGPVPGPRGAYVESREDHITTVLFQIWAAMPGVAFASTLLDLWDIPHGTISDIHWSYLWEQKPEPRARPNIADIVVSWRDEQGEAIFVVEAKRRGGKLGPKDLSGGGVYLDLPSVRPFPRRFVGFLVDQTDLANIKALLPGGTRMTSWQDMGRAQIFAATGLDLPTAERERLAGSISRHYADLGFSLGPCVPGPIDIGDYDGSERRYDLVRARRSAAEIESFLLGAEVVFCARSGRMPQAPHAWLLDEPSLLSLKERPQPTSERELPFWRLPPTGRSDLNLGDVDARLR